MKNHNKQKSFWKNIKVFGPAFFKKLAGGRAEPCGIKTRAAAGIKRSRQGPKAPNLRPTTARLGSIHKSQKNLSPSSLSLGKKGKFVFGLFAVSTLLVGVFTTTAFATGGDPLAVVSNLSDFIFSLIRAVGLILLGWGVVQVGLSFQSHDPSQRSQGFLTLAGGLVITFAKEILDLITGGA